MQPRRPSAATSPLPSSTPTRGTCYDTSELIDFPAESDAFYGQDAQYKGNVPSYTDNGDGTVVDNVTGLADHLDLIRFQHRTCLVSKVPTTRRSVAAITPRIVIDLPTIGSRG